MKKVSKAILVGVAILALVAVALAVGLNRYLQSAGSQARIQEELSRSLRLPLKLTNVSVSPFGGLHITGITIPNGEANFLEGASFSARYRLLPLLRGRLVITEMEVDTPKIVWTQTADGKWKLPAPEQAAGAARLEPPGTPSPAVPQEEKKSKPEGEKPATKKGHNFDVIVQRFEIKGGAVDLFDREKKHVAAFSDVDVTCTTLTAEHVEGVARIGKIVWADTYVLEEVHTPFKYSDGAFSLPEIVAAFAGGTLGANIHNNRPEKGHSPYKIAINFSKLDLDRMAVQTGAPAGQTIGSLSGQIEVHGDTQRPDRMDGEGRVDLRDGQFHQLDLLQNIGLVLGLRELSDLRVKDGHTEFRISGEKILVDKLALNTSDLQLSAHGTARLDKRLNLSAQLSVEESVVQRLPDIVRENFAPADGGRRVIDFAITGTTDKPKANLMDKLIGKTVNVQLGGLLNQLFGGDKKPDDKPKKEDKKPEKDHKKKDKTADQGASTPAPATPTPATPTTPTPAAATPPTSTPPAATPQPPAAAPNP